MKNARRLDHLHEKGALAAGDVVLRAHPREDAIHHADPRRARRHEAAHLGQDHQESRLAHEDALAAHVRPREDEDLLAGGIEKQVVGREGPLGRRVEDGMASVADVEDESVVHLGPDVPALVGDLGERGEGVEGGHGARRAQESFRFRGHGRAHLLEQLELETRHALLRAQDPALVLLELGGDVTLRPHEGLPPDVLLRNLGRVRVRDLDAVAEDPVEADTQRGDLGALALARLQRGDPLSRLLGAALDLLELGRERLPDETAFLETEGRVVLEGLGEERGESGQSGHLLTERGRDEARQLGELRAELRDGGQAAPKAHEVAGVGLPERGPTCEALEIADGAQARAQGGPPRRLLDQGRHRRLAPRDGSGVDERPEEPLPEEAGAHGRLRPVHGRQERATRAPLLGGLEELEGGHGGGIEDHGIARDKSLQPREMAQRLALGLAEIGERAAGGLKPRGHVAHSEALEGRHLELGGQRLPSRLEREPRGLPMRHGEAEAAQPGREGLVAVPGEQHLGRPPEQGRLQEGAAVVRALPCPEVPGGDVHEGEAQSGARARPVDGQEIVVGRAVEVLEIRDRARGHDAHDLAAHQLLALGRRLHLLAHRHLPARADQARDIRLGGVMRDARHGNGALALLPRGQGELKEACPQMGVLEEHLVEIAEAEQQEVVRVALLQLPVLLHHGRQLGREVPHAPSAAVSRSYVVSRVSGSTLVSPITGMKFVSPFQRGTTWRWRCPSTPAPATRPWLAPRLNPSG